MNQKPWYVRLANSLGFDYDTKQGRDSVAGAGKHSRGHEQYKHGNKRHEKIIRKIAAKSRRINRRK